MNTKKALNMFLCLVFLATLLVTPVSAAGTISITQVSFEAYEDSYGAQDDSLLTVEIRYTVPESVSQVTILLTGADIQTVTPDNKHLVVYQNQVAVSPEGTFRFPVEKSRIISATGQSNLENATLYLKMSGVNLSETASMVVTYNAPIVHYGDLNEDGSIDIGDAILVLRYQAGLNSLTVAQLQAADVTQDGSVDIGDGVRILRYEAGLVTTILKPQ